MAESFAQTIVDFFKDKIPPELIIFFISMLPILELRGGLIAAKLLGVEFVRAFIICYIGNIIPVPFILLFIRKIFQFLRDKKGFSKIIENGLFFPEKVEKTVILSFPSGQNCSGTKRMRQAAPAASPAAHDAAIFPCTAPGSSSCQPGRPGHTWPAPAVRRRGRSSTEGCSSLRLPAG